MGENPDFVFNTGCPAIDAISNIDYTLEIDFFKNAGGTAAILDVLKPYAVLLQHPVTTEYENARNQITETLTAVKKLNLQTLILWPNVDAGSDGISKGIRVFRENHREINNFQYIKNLSIENYAKLLKNAKVLIGNSSSGIREGAFLGVPVVNIGLRQHNRERSINVVDADYSWKDIYEKAIYQINHGSYNTCGLYGDGTSGRKIADILSKIEYVNLQKTLSY